MTLYLIPTPISEAAFDTLPPATAEVARRLEVFVVERARTARHFIKRVAPLRPLSELTFVELDREGGLTPEVVEVFEQALRQERDVGLLSEAGCPGVADPGAALVALAHRMGVLVVPLVGPSSVLLALMASGLNGQRFAFHGYLSPKRPELVRQLRQLEQQARQHDQTQIFMETPYRAPWIFEVALMALRADTLLSVSQDLTGPEAFVRTQPVRAWREQKLTLAARPTVFLMGKSSAG
ncbi:MAG: SAM-dependent methyltransferase [Saprospiraceae bacterium]|nr:SAM-dependent methyltransferase [Saprospiraceae bacterium]MDW8228424.1 SAM-dependent methyltransferase [Saprospiraceae bacterium]